MKTVWTCFFLAAALNFPLDYRQERCFSLDLAHSQGLSGAYVISGQGENNVMVRVEGPSRRALFQGAPRSREGKFELVTAESGKFRLCFKAFDRWPKSVSFDYLAAKPDQSASIPTEAELLPLYETTIHMRKSVETVQRNVRFMKQQERIHRDLTENTCDRVLWCAVAKVAVLTLVTAVQLGVLRKVGGSGSENKV